jgi:nitroimidazol reductase NimA-like FMN-containing flavoprotein (pyridoxamine 5'-phosphate oxidase superfamily)
MTQDATLRTQRTTLKRLPERGAHDFDTIAAILDEAIFCHIAFVADGQPYAIPTTFGRIDRALYIHGSAASRALRTLSEGLRMCFTATILDGLVFSRSAFHNSMNYRSVMVLGIAQQVDGEEKLRGLEAVTEHMVRGRWAESRPPTDQELKATSVLRLDIEEASAKVRTGGPKDEEADYALPIWGGHLPVSVKYGEPLDDGRVLEGVSVPGYVRNYRR